jgi:5-methylcytosine-specific restriction enzyme A
VTAWDDAKKQAAARDEGRCRRCGRPATDVHHRRPKGMGGTSDLYIRLGLANLVCLCRQCHDYIHAHPEEGYRTGFLVHSWDDPADVSLMLKSGTHYVRLRSDGEFETVGNYALF